jgi:acetyl-CoA acetyltransferase
MSPSRDVAVIGYAEWSTDADPSRNEVEIVMPVVDEAMEKAGLTHDQIDFTCSGSTDYLAGQPFSFVVALDAIGPWPPIKESHVEMDGAWALYEAWVKLQQGDADTALVYAFGKSSTGDLNRILPLQLDPYCMQPLWPAPADLAGLQATLIGAPLEEAPPGDGAAAIVLKVGGDGPVIRGIDHRIEPHALGTRDLTRIRSLEIAAKAAGVHAGDAAIVHAPFAHQAALVRDALGVTDIEATAGPLMVGGLMNIGRAAAKAKQTGGRVVGHATSGPCLQQNLVCVLS